MFGKKAKKDVAYLRGTAFDSIATLLETGEDAFDIRLELGDIALEIETYDKELGGRLFSVVQRMDGLSEKIHSANDMLWTAIKMTQ